MPASDIFLVLAKALRQQGDAASAPDAEAASSSTAAVVAGVLSAIVIVCIFFLVRHFFFSRRRRQTNPRVLESGAPTENDYLMYAYLQTQPPSVARLHRLANADGLSARELNEAAPVRTFSKASNASEDNVCAVCLEEMEAGAKTRKMPCGHEFDAKCIEEWVWKANRCPVCNTHVVDEEALQKRRFAVIQGRDPSPPTGRQRRRRIRGDNGVYEIRSGMTGAAQESSPQVSEPGRRIRGNAAGSSDARQSNRETQSTSVVQAAEEGHDIRPVGQVQAQALQPA